MNFLVTGGAGFIGSHVCRTLLASGSSERLVVLDDLSTGAASNLTGLDVELVEGTILDEKLVSALTAEADAVVHLAAVPAVARSLIDPRPVTTPTPRVRWWSSRRRGHTVPT